MAGQMISAPCLLFFHSSSKLAPSCSSIFFPVVLHPSAMIVASIGALSSTIAKQAPDADMVQALARTFAFSIARMPQ